MAEYTNLSISHFSSLFKRDTGESLHQLLSLSFNRMAERLNQLVNTVYNIELKEVQMQLLQKEATIHVLQSGKFGLVIQVYSKGGVVGISLAEELEHLKRYLEIIHIRYTRHFESKFFVDDKYLHARIIKLSIQPSVSSLGLTNVHNRLVLYYGKGYGIDIHSFPNQGTVISVKIPFIRKDNIS
ncbi:hypothetical protein [Paenibacillus prosopidis]|uniref:Uncharacterized protein n=1 Tax=Paenibacillus prosopidis TaxID=630520 RepID=A0A368W195_9BACL|nr:hypothetical protein [Paenibacillus prosopidis]RCW46408.1 hypothetical protein DFP97_10950 [Paenibacillus prosopidis]